MGSFSDFLENELLDHAFKTGAYTPATNLYVGLSLSTITDAHTGSTVPGEPRSNSHTPSHKKPSQFSPSKNLHVSDALILPPGFAEPDLITDRHVVNNFLM